MPLPSGGAAANTNSHTMNSEGSSRAKKGKTESGRAKERKKDCSRANEEKRGYSRAEEVFLIPSGYLSASVLHCSVGCGFLLRVKNLGGLVHRISY